MRGMSRRLKKLECLMTPMVFSFMDRYNEIHNAALARLTAADRRLWHEWAALRNSTGSSALTDTHKAAGRRWVDAFDAVAKETAFHICPYDQWL